MTSKLADVEKRNALQQLNRAGWSHLEARDAISKSFKFRNFVEALGWMVKVGLLAEKNNHHPELNNCYNHVEVTLTTHDAGGLTDRDINMAQLIDKLR